MSVRALWCSSSLFFGHRLIICKSFSLSNGMSTKIGCVPKKLMVFASRYPGEISEMAGYGWKGATPGEFDWKVFLENKNKVRVVHVLFMYVRECLIGGC